mgnify:CR=1 FL=1
MKPKPKLSARDVQALAYRITDELLTAGDERRGARLQIRGPSEEDLGGRCETAIVHDVALVIGEYFGGATS